MTAAPNQSLVERVKDAIQAAYANVPPHTRMPQRWDRMAQAALDACRAEEMRVMLRKLITVYHSESLGYDPQLNQRIVAEAEALLASLDGKPSGGAV